MTTDARRIHDADQTDRTTMDESPSADQLIGHVEEIAHSVRRMRERIEESAIVEAARIRAASQSARTLAEEHALIARATALLSMKGPAQLFERLESDLLRVRGLPKER